MVSVEPTVNSVENNRVKLCAQKCNTRHEINLEVNSSPTASDSFYFRATAVVTIEKMDKISVNDSNPRLKWIVSCHAHAFPPKFFKIFFPTKQKRSTCAWIDFE